VRVANSNGGTINFSNPTKTLNTATNKAVTLDTSSGNGTVAFGNGGLDIDTTSGGGFSATGGGTVTVGTGTNPNTIDSTTGTALNVSNTTIGSSGLTFRSISANGAPNGIVLNNTGTSGGLTVTGASGNCTAATPTCTGGRIQNTVGADGATAGNGIYLNNTRQVSLNLIRLNGHANNGVYGTGVRGLTIDHSLFDGLQGSSNSGTFDESAIQMVDIGGAVSITNSDISGGAFNNVRLENISGTAPALALTFEHNTLGTMQGSVTDVRSTAVLVNVTDGQLTAQINDNTVTYWWGNAIHVLVQGTATGTANITNNTAHQTSGALAGAGGIWVAGGTLTYNISGNSVRNTNGTAISADRTQFGSTMQGTIANNLVGASGVANSGSATGIGIFASHHGPGTTIVKITGNTLRQINGSASGAITTITGDAAGFGGSGAMNATITSNDIREFGTTVNSAQHGILITHGVTSSSPGDSDLGCYDIGGAGALANVIQNFNTASGAAAQNRIRVNQRFFTTSRWPGYTGAATGPSWTTDMATYLLGRNTASNSTNANTSSGGFLNTSPAGSACPQPAAVPQSGGQ